jgi:superfamily I DNA/RNA helicase
MALSNPVIAADFILLDEAQDTNPVVLEVLRKQSAQMIYVGDKYQRIS